MADNTPRVLGGRYEVGELIGRGGMAEVHIGHDTRLGRTVAIKILRSDLARDQTFLARFRREAQAAAALNYPAIVAVYDSGEDTHTDPITGGQIHVPYIVMEYVEGHTVREILNHGDAVPIDEAVEITSGVLSALDYSHHAGIIHRDIKPGNVMITPTGSVKVMDFGIARAVADSHATMTQTQAVIGTAQYLSPEQARGETVDARSDVYSTGCLLFELLTGRPPFVGDSPVAVAYQHVGQAPKAPSDLASDVPPDLDRITLKALAKERSQRYSSAADFKADLDAFLAGQSISVASPTVVSPATPPLGATQVFQPGGPAATQVFRPGAAETQHLGAVAGPVSATAVYGAHQFPGAVPPVVETVMPGSHAPAALGGNVSDWAAANPANHAAALYPTNHQVPVEPVKSNRSKVLLWTLLPLAIVGLGLAAFFLTRGGGTDHVAEAPTALVPTFTEGITQPLACAEVEAVGFHCDPQIDANTNAPEGMFLRQSPSGGSTLEVGAPVTLWFSGGPSMIALPDVTGFTLDQARARIEDAGLHVGDVTQENDREQPAGNVTRTQPSAGIAVGRGQTIGIYISTGQVDLPDLVGHTQADAIAQLNERRLTSRPEFEATATRPPGTVLRQSPAAGVVDQGTTVTLFIAEAPAIEMLTVPAVTGASCTDATSQLVTAGFNVTTDNQASQTYYAGIVIGTSPEAGTQLEADSTVTVRCSLGPGPTTAPTPPPPTTTPEPPESGGDGTEQPGGGDEGNPPAPEGQSSGAGSRRGLLRELPSGEDGEELPIADTPQELR